MQNDTLIARRNEPLKVIDLTKPLDETSEVKWFEYNKTEELKLAPNVLRLLEKANLIVDDNIF